MSAPVKGCEKCDCRTEQERAMVDRLKNRVGELGDERDRLLGELRSSRQLDALTIRSMRTQRDRAVALLREVCETSYDDLAALRGNINAACDWLESLDGPDSPRRLKREAVDGA